MKAEGQARLELPRNPGCASYFFWAYAGALPVAGCTRSEGMKRPKIAGVDTVTGPALASPHACCFVSWLLHCTHRRPPCFQLVAMLLRCHALPLSPRRSNGPALVAVANAKGNKNQGICYDASFVVIHIRLFN